MYPTRHSSAAGRDRQQHDNAQQSQQQSFPTQYAQPLGVPDWNNQLYYPPGEFVGDLMPADFPVGDAYSEDWNEQFAGAPHELSEHVATAGLPAHHQDAQSLHRTASAPLGGQESPRPPLLRSQSTLADSQDFSASRHSSLVPEGQPGSSSAGASGATTPRRVTSTRYASRSRLEEENRLLLELRDRQHLPWREVTRRFEQTYAREYRMPTLQMRYGRLKNASQANRQRLWQDEDTEALRQAWQWYMQERWNIIADRMLHYGATEQWTPQECEAAWRRLTGEGAGTQPDSD